MAASGFLVELYGSTFVQAVTVEYPPSVVVHRLDQEANSSWKKYLRFVTDLVKRSSKDTDVFIGHDMHGLLVARLLSWRYGKPLIYHCHEYVDSEAAKQLNWGGHLVFLFQKYLARTADLVVIPDQDRAYLMKGEFRLDNDLIVATNSPLSPISESGVRLRDELEERGKRFEQIVFRQGSIGPSHAIETTLQSMQYWSSRAWGFVIMGSGAPDYIQSLHQQAIELGVAEQFVVLPPVSYDDVLKFTPGASLGHSLYSPVDANNRYSTTASNKLMEYMAAGLPLLVSDRPGLRDLVTRHGCGVVADEDNPESIARSINYLLANPEQAKQMGSNGRQAFFDTYCYERQFAPVLVWMQTQAAHR
jgi:glycosyltransferase involved in cell wall biosynthesis